MGECNSGSLCTYKISSIIIGGILEHNVKVSHMISPFKLICTDLNWHSFIHSATGITISIGVLSGIEGSQLCFITDFIICQIRFRFGKDLKIVCSRLMRCP